MPRVIKQVTRLELEPRSLHVRFCVLLQHNTEYIIGSMNHIGSVHQVRYQATLVPYTSGLIFNVGYIDSLFACTTLIAYIILALYCVHVPCHLQLPCFMLVTCILFLCHYGRLYYHPHYCCFHYRRILYPYCCHMTCITFLWEENTSCPFAIGFDHMICFDQ